MSFPDSDRTEESDGIVKLFSGERCVGKFLKEEYDRRVAANAEDDKISEWVARFPKCPQCFTPMQRKTQPLCVPDTFMQCPRCGLVINETVEQFYGREPHPDWVLPPD